MLPERVRAYRNALQSGDLHCEENHRIQLCSVIECLLELNVEGCTGCEVISMIDGILPASIDLSEAAKVSIVGLAVWTGKGGWFLDPVAVVFELSEDCNFVRKYTLMFGDAKTGLRKYPFKPHSKDLYRSPPSEWRFVFGHSESAKPFRRGAGDSAADIATRQANRLTEGLGPGRVSAMSVAHGTAARIGRPDHAPDHFPR
jgi:hypothetical protein